MTRKHSTRLSQAHDENPEDEGQHTAARDYPELGTILDDRPDPGRQITVIGSRIASAYGTEDDARNSDYNGGEGDLGMNWAEPANQDWMHENIGPQEEAPPPPWAISPVMARLFELEEAAGFFGREATTINGTQVDDAGDAPQHGTIPRADDPDGYDDASDEGGGDDKWNEALPWGDKKNENAATVGMYPEGISSGNGPGISVGPFTAGLHEARVPWTGAERGSLHRWQEEPTATWGDFVNSAEFLDSPAERSNVRHEEDGEGIGVVEAASDRQWEMHLRKDHGWGDANFANVARRGDRLGDMHEALHSAGLANHQHAGGPEQALQEAHEQTLRNMFGRDITENGPRMLKPEGYPLAAPERGGASGDDPMIGIIRSKEHPPLRHPDYWEQADPGRFRRMMSALDPPHPHDDDSSYLDAGPAEGDELFRMPHSDAESPWRTAAFNVHVRIDGQELKHEHDDEDNSLDHDEDKTPDSPVDKNSPEIESSQADDGDSLDSPADIPADIPGPGKPGGKSSGPADAKGLPPDHPMSDPANWPAAGAGVNERERAYTQGSDDGKVSRGAPAPGSFSPDDGDSGGGGDQGDDKSDGDQPDDDTTPFSKDAALGMFAAAAGNREFRWEFTATWHDVMAKAKRIRAEGHVRITHASAGMVIGEVRGDHDIYESGIQRPVG
jgi:hypothetical protein